MSAPLHWPELQSAWSVWAEGRRELAEDGEVCPRDEPRTLRVGRGGEALAQCGGETHRVVVDRAREVLVADLVLDQRHGLADVDVVARVPARAILKATPGDGEHDIIVEAALGGELHRGGTERHGGHGGQSHHRRLVLL